MSTATDLRGFAQELRPIVDRGLDDAEIVKGLRQAATDKGIDWSQLKALVKAQAQDARDDGNRVEKLVERAEYASAYADMLATNMNENGESCSSSNDPTVTISNGSASAEMKLSTLGKIAEAAQTETGRKVLSAAVAAVQISDGLDIPPFLDRRQQASA